MLKQDVLNYNANDGLHSWEEICQGFYNCISARNVQSLGQMDKENIMHLPIVI